MKLSLSVLFVIFLSSHVYSSGPTYPENYRNLSKEELASEWREKDPGQYTTIAADFNGDELVDGAFLLVDDRTNQIVLLVALYNKNSSYTWIELQRMDYEAFKYQGISSVEPAAVSAYKDDTASETKHSMALNFHSIKSFSSEGASSIFTWDSSGKRFQQHWLTK